MTMDLHVGQRSWQCSSYCETIGVYQAARCCIDWLLRTGNRSGRNRVIETGGSRTIYFMALVALESAAVLSKLAQSAATGDGRINLMHSGELFENLASNYANRAEIYRERGTKQIC